MPGWIHLLPLCCLSVVSALAQPVSIEAEATHANALLESTKPVDRAWGAYLAANLRLEACQGKVLNLLREATPLPMTEVDDEDYAYVQSLLDASIQLDVKVGKDEILPFSTTWPAETIILLARDAKANERPLLELRNQRLTYYEWLAVSNLLLGLRSPRFFVETFKKLPAQYSFKVVDRELPACGILGGISESGVGSSLRRYFPAGFPPASIYDFTMWSSTPGRGSVFLAGGPQNSYYRRIAVEKVSVPTRHSGSSYSGFEKEYLARLSGFSVDEVEHIFHRSATIHWTNAAEFNAAVSSLMDGQAAELRRFVAAAQSSLRTRFEEFQVHVSASVQDFRDVTTTSLPAVGSRDLTLP